VMTQNGGKVGWLTNANMLMTYAAKIPKLARLVH
jgi:hypothetical protein